MLGAVEATPRTHFPFLDLKLSEEREKGLPTLALFDYFDFMVFFHHQSPRNNFGTNCNSILFITYSKIFYVNVYYKAHDLFKGRYGC